MYEKSIILTQDKRLEQSIKLLLRSKKMGIETDLPLLSNLNLIKNDIQRNYNTLNMRGEFGVFLKKHGFPYMTILDYEIDLGLPENLDPDMKKLLRTFLIAFSILANGKGYGSAIANIVLIVNKKFYKNVSQYEREPSSLLEQLKTQDDRVNAIMQSFANNRDRVRAFFNISHIFKPEDGKYHQEIESLEKIINGADERLKSKQRKTEDRGVTEMITDDLEPANVICRATLDKILINGDVRQISEEEKEKYHEKNINLKGAITVKTINTVTDRIINTFQAMSKLNPFKKDEKIFINIPDTSLIDGSFSPSMGSFLSDELSEYAGISLNIGKNNCEKLKNSRGFIAIKDFLIKNL